MQTTHPIPTTEMQVTSIRLERDLKDRLKTLAGRQGYQTLIREILWDYVHQRTGDHPVAGSGPEISASIVATAHREERCALSNQIIHPQDPMLLGLTTSGTIVPLAADCFS